jgi:hypothetical protein
MAGLGHPPEMCIYYYIEQSRVTRKITGREWLGAPQWRNYLTIREASGFLATAEVGLAGRLYARHTWEGRGGSSDSEGNDGRGRVYEDGVSADCEVGVGRKESDEVRSRREMLPADIESERRLRHRGVVVLRFTTVTRTQYLLVAVHHFLPLHHVPLLAQEAPSVPLPPRGGIQPGLFPRPTTIPALVAEVSAQYSRLDGGMAFLGDFIESREWHFAYNPLRLPQISRR